MLKKFVFKTKFLALAAGILLGIVSCEKDLKDMGVNLVDNAVFTTGKFTPAVVSYVRNIDRNKTNAMPDYLLGTYRDNQFGKIEASVVGQLSLPEENPDFGTNAVIDSVLFDIPIPAHVKKASGAKSLPEFELDSVWTKGNATFQLDVYELGTFLNTWNPEDPATAMAYFSDDNFIKKNPATPLFSGLVSPSPTDTLTIIKRYKYPNYPDLSEKVLYKTDSIKKSVLAPSLKLTFDNATIKALFQDVAAGADFASNGNFQHYFRGLYFDVHESTQADAALMILKMTAANMTIYYSYDEIKDEAENEDLDGNGVNGESDVHVRKPKSLVFPMNGIKANLYNRDYSGSELETILATTDINQGSERLYVQGAAGSHAVIKLFGEDADNNGVPDELEMIRQNNWLINDAKLSLYIDKEHTPSWVPERLYLYNIGAEENTQIADAMPQAMVNIGGELKRDADNQPEKYVFSLREYMTALLHPDSETPLYDLGLKVFDQHDIPHNTTLYDTILRKYDANPKGVVLKGNLPLTDEQRVQLEIFYSKAN